MHQDMSEPAKKIGETQFILLYPWPDHRDAFLRDVVGKSQRPLYRYQLTDADTTLTDWLKNLMTVLTASTHDGPSNLQQALSQEEATLWGQALAADLNQIATGDAIWFFLEEMDRLPHDIQLEQFIEALVHHLSDNVYLAVSSRLLQCAPWRALALQNEAVVFGPKHRAHEVIYTRLEEPKPALEVYGFGRGYAEVNLREIENWDGALPRNLFFFFIDNPLVTRDEIFAAFWPKLATKEATNVFHVTKRKISERITMKVETDGNYELTQYSTGFYKPSEKLVRYYDVGAFEDAVGRAMITLEEDEEEALLERAIDLYKGPFLADVDMPWIVKRREVLQGLYAQALIGLGRLSQARGESVTALGYYVRALKETPYREDIHRDIMQIYINQGMLDDARQQYHTLKALLAENMDIAPAHETRALFERIAEQTVKSG